MEKNVEVSISILNANFLNLDKEIQKAKDLGIKYLHFDVMDGHFVPNISFGVPILSCIKHNYGLINDVHLMISDPKKYLNDFVEAGADIITFHFEALDNINNIKELIDLVHSYGVRCGVSIKPNTKPEVLLPFIKDLDLILVMSVEPGFGGQSFIESSLNKIEFLSNYKIENGLKYLIEVDGGINNITFKKCAEKGVDICVIGSYLYKSKNIQESYELLRK